MKMQVNVNWKKVTDFGFPRCRSIGIEMPVERKTTPLEDVVLSTGSANLTVRIEEPLKEPPTDEQCIRAILGYLAEREKAREDEMRRHLREARESEGGGNSWIWGLRFLFEEESYDSPFSRDAEMYLTEAEKVEARQLLRKFAEYLVETYTASTGTLYGRFLSRLPSDLEEKLKEKKAMLEEEKKAKEEAERKRQEDSRLKREQDKKERREEAAEWVAEHGSTRLRKQLDLGLDGWPLYLHERLDKEFEGLKAELHNDGEDGDEIINPTEEQLRVVEKVAERLAQLGLAPDMKEAARRLDIREVVFENDDGEYFSLPCILFEGWRPGKHPSWKEYTIRFGLPLFEFKEE